MAGKFMVVKRIIIPFMSLVILASQLTGCAALSSQEFMEEANKGQDVVIEYTELAPPATSVNVGGQDFTIDIPNEQTPTSDATAANMSAVIADTGDVGVVSSITDTDQQQAPEVERTELTQAELKGYFKQAYDSSVVLDEGTSLEDKIAFELTNLKSFVDATADKKLPADYESQYRFWRAFSPVEETVYATGTVNIRSGPSTETEKVGSLSRGQSVTRTGVGTGDYAKWSRVELEDGTTVYIASSYLSTTKPTSQTTSGGGTTQTTKPGGSTGSSNTQTQPSSSKTGDGSDLPAGITFNKPSSSTGGYAEDSGAQGGYTQQDLDEIAQGITGG